MTPPDNLGTIRFAICKRRFVACSRIIQLILLFEVTTSFSGEILREVCARDKGLDGNLPEG